jgi:hypothetical protein
LVQKDENLSPFYRQEIDWGLTEMAKRERERGREVEKEKEGSEKEKERRKKERERERDSEGRKREREMTPQFRKSLGFIKPMRNLLGSVFFKRF